MTNCAASRATWARGRSRRRHSARDPEARERTRRREGQHRGVSQAEAAARADLAAQKRALDEKRDALARLKAATSGAASGETVHTKAIVAARVAILDRRPRSASSNPRSRPQLSSALKGIDLGVFEANARAAFDSSEQGALRLQAALYAIGDETLRRVGTSADELRTGFSKAANSAINDVDSLARKLLDLGVTGAAAGRLLSESLNKAADAASSERAVPAVIARFEALGRQGLLTGDQLAAGLEKARAKLDQLAPRREQPGRSVQATRLARAGRN